MAKKTKWRGTTVLFCVCEKCAMKMCAIKCSRFSTVFCSAIAKSWLAHLATYNCMFICICSHHHCVFYFIFPFVRFTYRCDFISCTFSAVSLFRIFLQFTIAHSASVVSLLLDCFLFPFHFLFSVLFFVEIAFFFLLFVVLTCQSWCVRLLGLPEHARSFTVQCVLKWHLPCHSTLVYSICTYIEMFLINLLKCMRVNNTKYSHQNGDVIVRSMHRIARFF